MNVEELPGNKHGFKERNEVNGGFLVRSEDGKPIKYMAGWSWDSHWQTNLLEDQGQKLLVGSDQQNDVGVGFSSEMQI